MEDDQQFCLRWNNHQSTIIQNFDTLLESGTLVDCTLAAEGKYLKAHKVVLSACSPYFEGLLSEHYDKHPVFILKDVKFKELKAMMDYMYRGEVNISQDQLTALLKAAESLQIKGLSDSRTDKGTGNTGNTTTGGSKDNTRPAKTASSTAAASASAAAVDIPHSSSGLTIEKNSKVPRQSIQQVSVSDQLENSASPQLRGHSSREGSQSPTRKRKRLRRRSLGNDDNSMENHEASNSSDVNMTAPALGVAPVAAEEKNQADPADSIGRSALMQQLTKPADEMLQMPLEKPEPSEDMIQPKSEYQDDQESVEDLTHFDDDMNDLNEMEQDNSRAGPSHDPSQHGGIQPWHIAGDRSNASVVGAAAGPGAGDEVFLAAAEAAQAQRDSQGDNLAKNTDSNEVSDEDVIILDDDLSDANEKKQNSKQQHDLDEGRISIEEIFVKEEINVGSDDFTYLDASHGYESEDEDIKIKIEDVRTLPSSHYDEPSTSYHSNSKVVLPRASVSTDSSTRILLFCSLCGRKSSHTKNKNRNCNSCKTRLHFMCSLCDKNYSTLTRLRYHIYYGCSGDYRCTYPGCEYVTHDWSELRDHQRLQHNVLPGVAPTPTSPEANLRCSHCSKWFRQMRSLQKHQLLCSGMKRNVKEKSYSCPLCDYSARRYKDIKQHEEDMHGMVKKRGFYDCPYCSKKIVNVKKLRLHVKSCKFKVDIFSCEHCDYKGKSKIAFMQHLKNIHPDL